jgi:uncharacterized radical SAM superfamily protein
MTQDALLKEAWKIRQRNFAPTIRFDYPLNTLVVSLTGGRCELDCAHCGGYYLQHMVPIWEADAAAATSCLVSGGCDSQGRVPVTSHLDLVAHIRSGRLMNWHVGLIGQKEAEAILDYVDIISFDFVGDQATIEEVYGIPARVQDYADTYRLLRAYASVVPHITVGLRGGCLSGEYQALEMLEDAGAEALTFIVFIPTPGTRYADCPPTPPEEVAKLIAEARLRFPSIPLHLGCMRPRGAYRDRVDALAVQAGVNAIVSPSRSAVTLAREVGLLQERGDECCAVTLLRKAGHERAS